MGIFRLVFCLFAFFSNSLAADASSALVLDGKAHPHYLGIYMEALEDREGRLTFDEVILPSNGEKFVPLGGDIPNFGFSRSAFWLRAPIRNPGYRAKTMILEELSGWIDSVDVYIVGGLNEVSKYRAGESLPFSARIEPHSHFIFPVELESGAETVIYIRVADKGPLQTPFVLWTNDEHESHIQRVDVYYGLVFGVMAAVLLYNLFLYLTLRDRNYLLFVLYILFTTAVIFIHAGFSFQYLWPDSPNIQKWSPFPIGYMAMFMAAAFAKSFLSAEETAPGINTALTAFQGLCGALVLSAFIWSDPYFASWTIAAAGALCMMLLLFAGLAAYRAGLRSARYFALGQILAAAGVGYSIHSLSGYGPAGAFSIHAVEVGLVMEALILSFALADRVKIMRSEAEIAEVRAREALSISRERLEAMVAERTAELQSAKEKAEAASALKDKFVGMVSHDLRAPIGSLMNMVKFIKIDDPDTPAVAQNEEIVSRIVASSERLLRMVDTLLNITRLATGKVDVARRPVNMRHLVSAHILSIDFIAMEKGVTITNELPHDLRLSVDPELFGEVISNLLTNAVKFCRKGDAVTVFKPELMTGTIAIRDTGIGIDSRLMADIFSFESAKSTPGTSGETGSGLGLPYCHEIMTAHGGMIRAESEKGSGSVFYLELP